MSDTRVDFSAPAELRKWPSLNNERVSASLGARPYMIGEGTLAECIQQFMELASRSSNEVWCLTRRRSMTRALLTFALQNKTQTLALVAVR
jgi:hypothetical protein